MMMSRADDRLARGLRGVSGILVTPFDGDDRIAADRLRPIVDRAVAAGVGTLVINGNTSEFYALTSVEAEAMVQASARIVAGRLPLIGGVGRGIHDALALTRASREAGVDALMIHQPPDPFVAPRGFVDYVSRIVEAGQDLPVVLYLRDDGIGTEMIARLCAIPNVVGIKWAAPTPMRLAEAIAACDPALIWSGGLAETWAPAFYAVGARGFTSGLINVCPQVSVAICQALERSDYAAARTMIAAIAVFETLRAQERNGTNVSVVKAALHLLGEDCGVPRPPAAWPLSPQVLDTLRAFLAQMPAAALVGA